MEDTRGVLPSETYTKITVIALGVLWLAFLSIVTYVEMDTRRDLAELSQRLWLLEQKVIVIETRQQAVLATIAQMEERLRAIEKVQWGYPGNRYQQREKE
jgi:hypothetical protein